MTYIKKLAEDCWAVYGWNGRDWFCNRVCYSQKYAKNAARRLRRILRARVA